MHRRLFARMVYGLLLALALLSAARAGRAAAQSPAVSAPGRAPTIVQIAAPTQAQVNALAARVDVWEVDYAQGVVIAAVDAATITQLRALGYVVVEDGARTRAARNAALPALPALPALTATEVNSDTIPGYACYRTVAQTYADMDALAAAHPNLARWQDYGDSWDKLQPGGPPGNDLRALVITNRAKPGPKFPFVVIAAIHARELATAEVAARFAELLINGYGSDPTITWLLDYGALTIVPMTNPDGRLFAEQLMYWRKNTHDEGLCTDPPTAFSTYGVDLNRNSSFSWGACTANGCSSTYACSLVYRGGAPASEPETQALQDLITPLFADQRGPNLGDAAPPTAEGLFITLHSFGQLVLYPWGFTGDPSPNQPALQALGNEFGARTGYTVCQTGAPGCLYATDGTTDDWTYGTLGVASYTIEMGTQFFEGCTPFEKTINPSVADALLYGFAAARRPYQWPQGPAALDATLTPTRVVQGAALALQLQLALPAQPPSAQAGAGAVTGADIITGASVWLDAPPWGGSQGTPLLAADGAFDSAAEVATVTLDTSTWTLGRHMLMWQAAGTAGDGLPGARFIDVTASPTADPTAPEPPAPGGSVYLPFTARPPSPVQSVR